LPAATRRQAGSFWGFPGAIPSWRVSLCTAAVETVRDPAMAANLDRLGVRVVLKPFDVDNLLTAILEVLAAQALINQARVGDLGDEA
jgi:hypothetical protein